MIELSDHAKEQNKKREIPKEWIIETVKHPEEMKDSFRGRKLRRKKFGDKILEVITVIQGTKIIVITQYYLGIYDESKIRS